MTMAEAGRRCTARAPYLLERNALDDGAEAAAPPDDRAPALVELLWERYGMLPRNLILVEVTHPKVPYVHDNRYHVTVFDRDERRGSVIGVELRFGFMEEPNVERYLDDMARHKEIDLPAQPTPMDRPRLPREPAARRGAWACAGACASACSCFCASSPARPITPMASATRCSFRPRSCRCG